MTKSVKFLFLGILLFIGIVLQFSPSAEAKPIQFPERNNKPVTSAPSVETQGNKKCPRGYRLVHGNCRKAYGWVWLRSSLEGPKNEFTSGSGWLTSELFPPQQVLSSGRRIVNLKRTKSLYFLLRAFIMLITHAICKVLCFVPKYWYSLYWYSWRNMIRTRTIISYYFFCFKCLNAYVNSLCNFTLINPNHLKCITHLNLCNYYKIQLSIVLSIFNSLRSLICNDNGFFFKVVTIDYEFTSSKNYLNVYLNDKTNKYTRRLKIFTHPLWMFCFTRWFNYN